MVGSQKGGADGYYVSINFNRTRAQIADMVLSKLGVKIGAATALTADVDLVAEAIDMRLKEMHRLGIYWRKVLNVPLTFSVDANVRSASATADIAFPISLTFTDGSDDFPVSLINPRQYAQIEDKTETGTPEKALWDRSAKFTLWPVPESNGTMKLLYEQIADDSTAGAAIDVDVSMIRWIRDMVCYDCGDYYGKSDTTMMRFKAECEIAERNIRKLNAPAVNYEPVAVDDWISDRNTETDYGWRQ